MKKRRLGNSELFVSEMGFGCMSLGTDEKKAAHILHAAIDEGITYFDTADLYDFGRNEEIVGKALKPFRDKVVLSTKAGNRWNERRDGWSWDPSKQYIKAAVKDSLKRLGTDYIDLYQLHGGTIDDPIDETIEAFEELVQEGYIRYYGISSIRPNVIKQYLKRSSIVSIMMQYSLFDRRPEEWLPLIEENHVSVIARGPVAKGLLSDKMLSKASGGVKDNGYLDYSFQELEHILPLIAEKLPSRSMNEIALKYVLTSSTVGAIIPGASTIEQLQENVKAVNSPPLTEEEQKILNEITKQSIYESHRH
ncbi:aldo/keto reductase [Peribacillus saganii]|uniref:Aldo/keto reductase n=1 Tax=Peribacillus saganii TaxID=2303992 RepID=A0A372LLH6_9BACI|nr:aldo/keto reductase [Peribacillus saganii]RFU67755.1 aldo/keto reductase [Peribacillus saganii]